MVLALLLACNQYVLEEKPSPPAPEVDVLAGALAANVCPDTVATVDVVNTGDGTLMVTGLTMEGTAWVLDAPELPIAVPPGSAYTASLTGDGGEGTLVVTTNDADEPVVRVPIAATENLWPAARIVSPAEEAVLPAEGDVTFLAFVGDDDDALSELTLEWVSSLSGTMGTSIPAEDGSVSFVWPAEARVAGPQFVHLNVWDPCGGQAQALSWFCQDGPYVVHPIEDEAWHYEGAARMEDDTELVLTDPASTSVGSAFDLATVFDGDDVELAFAFQIAGEGEGLSVTLLDIDRREAYVGGDGCGMGFGGGADCTSGPGLPGWSLAIDTAAGAGDCLEGPHVAFAVDGDLAALGPCAPIPAVDDGAWHTLHLRVAEGSLTVTLDGAEVLAAATPAALDFQGMIGFTASTTGAGAEHRVRAVEVIDYTCI